MMDTDAIVVGAGVVGLAVARALALAGRSVISVESAETIGTETSSRNSEVIHAGLYYPEGSLKARFCVSGRRQLYAYCEERHISHRRCGKIIVACDAKELHGLEALARRGAANGVDDLALISAAEARALEPDLACVGALLSPSTGIVDSHALMLALQADALQFGADFAFRTPFARAGIIGGGFAVETGGVEPVRLTASVLVNCAGLHAAEVAGAIDGLDPKYVPTIRFAKGNYFSLSTRAPFRRLVYPAPHSHGLGVHMTLDLAGRARFGPDVEWVDEIDYDVDFRRCEGFTEAIRRYWPGLPDDALTPAYSGVRAKLGGPDDPASDFRIDGPDRHGVPGLVNLFGIESPGLTSALAIADEVADMLR
jgi:L-2-hydroxyglutarate oxidase LhgO